MKWITLLAVAGLCHAQDIPSKVDEYLNAFVKPAQFMGSVLVAKSGKILVAKGYGMADIEWDVPNTAQTKFRLGSITKQFTATAIMQLAERGKLNTDDPVSKYIPDSPADWKDISIRHLLTHTSGIHNYTAVPEYARRMREPTTPAQLLARFKDLPLDFPPGSKFLYSNSGYSVLGMVIEKASAQSYESYLQENIFDPLEMRNTGYDYPETVLKFRASGYSKRGAKLQNAPFLDMGIPFSAGSLYSTVEDLYRWDRALYTEKILPKAALEKMFTPNLANYGFGWTIQTQSGHKVISHNGGINGFATHIARYPDDDVCIIVLGNMDGPFSGRIGQGLAAIVFGRPYDLPKQRTAISLDPAALARFTGTYEDGPRTFTIRMDSGHLTIQATGQPEVEMISEAPSKFFLEVVEAQVEFQGDQDGKAAQLTLHQGGRDFTAKRKP